MKTELILIHRDEAYEKQTQQEIELARESCQAIVDIWISLDIGPVTDLSRLINNPQQAHGEAVKAVSDPPPTMGRFQLSKTAYMQLLDIPVPDSLFRSCRDARKQQYVNYPGLWRVEGTMVVADADAAQALCNAKNIYVPPDRKEIVEKVLNWMKLTNELNTEFLGQLIPPEPHVNSFLRGKFVIKDMFLNIAGRSIYKYDLSGIAPEFLQKILSGNF